MLIIPQGLTDRQFSYISAKVRGAAAHLGNDIHVHGSRAAGTAEQWSDLDIAIRVSPENFEKIHAERFGIPNPGSAKAKTMHHAMETGKIQVGEAGLRSLRKAIEAYLGIEVDLAVIQQGGPFDRGPFLPLMTQ